MAANSGAGKWVVAIILISAAIAGGVYFFYPAGGEPEPVAGGGLTVEQRVALVEEQNVAVGLLENGRNGDAAERYALMVTAAPDEMLPLRNLVIARLLGLDELKQRMLAEAATDDVRDSAMRAAVNSAIEAAEQLVDRRPDSPTAHWLAALAWMSEQPVPPDPEALQRALTHLEAASSTAGEIVARYALFDMTQHSDDPALVVRGQSALREAYETAPNNLTLLRYWLVTQARQQDKDIVQTLTDAKPVIQPLKKRTTIDIEQLLQDAYQAVDDGNWQMVFAKVSGFSNVISSDDFTRSDLKRVAPHPLEFVMHRFSDEFYVGLPEIDWDESTAIAIELRPADAEQWPSLEAAGVTGLRVVDVNFDNAVDVVSIEPKRLRIHTRDEAAAAWPLTAEIELPDGLEQFVMADLFMVDSTRRPMTPTVSAVRDEDAAAAAEAARRFDTYQAVIAFGTSGLRLIRVDLDEAESERLLDVTEASGIGGLSEVRAVLPIDIEHDGDLDLVSASAEGIRVWSNRGNMTFDDISEFSVLPPADISMATMVAVDWDRDVDLDIVAAGPQADSLGVLENVRHGQFRWRPLGDEFSKVASASSLSLVDVDSNVSWDLLAVGESGAALLQTATPLPGAVKALAERSFSDQAARLGMTADFDNDSFTDFVTLGDDGLRVFRGRGSAGFVLFDGALPEPINPVTFDLADLDADGDLDLAVATDGEIRWLFNEGGNRNHWIDLRVRGIDPLSPSGRVNHFAIGSLVEVRSGLRYQPFVISRPTTHVGLGRVAQPDLVRVTLTNGIPQVVLQPRADQVVFEKMILKGSCPFAYTWTGERFEFFTDLLWAAPLGLQSAEGVLAPSRPWEYLLLPGDRLSERDGEYVLQVTEELWEAAYFDQIELIAVDHPSDVAIYSNEKVGPPSIAEFQLHAVREPRRPIRATDQAGRDWSAALAERDGRYAAAFDGRIRQGLTEPTYIELDLGRLETPERITLFLTGWIQPGDTSLNIALSQDPRLEAARYPSIQTPDAEGNWREAVPFMGFPGGKPKTIAVDLSHVFAGDDYRLRIATTAEIYWDEAFFAVDEAAAETHTASLELLSADLHYRGFSARLPRGPHDPERFDYGQVTTEPQWPPMSGQFTRYGEVAELLRATDDRLMIMGSGDEVTLRFAVPEQPLPVGWRRDFILHNVGWDKDADLNTIYGQTVEPLPFVSMRDESDLLLAPRSNAASFDDYLREYQTREQPGVWFWRALAN